MTTTYTDLGREIRDTGLEVDELRNDLGFLRDELAALRHQLRTEVRTRRLVVVDKRGREIIVGEVFDYAAELQVRWPLSDAENSDDEVALSMYAGEEADPAWAGFSLRSKDEDVLVGQVRRVTNTMAEE